MTDIDKLWGELVLDNGLTICGVCKFPSDECTCDDGPKLVTGITLSESDLSALVERVRGEAVKEYTEQLRASCKPDKEAR